MKKDVLDVLCESPLRAGSDVLIPYMSVPDVLGMRTRDQVPWDVDHGTHFG